MTARWSAVLASMVILLQTSASRAESPLRLASSIESGAVVPTSSTKELVLSLQLLVPFARAAGIKAFAGLGPVAMTRHLSTSNLPELVAFGAAGAFRLEF